MRFYRVLLRLYPRSFRQEYGDELARVFSERHAGSSWIARAAAALADVVPAAIATHGDILRQDLGYTSRTLRRAPGFAVTTILVVALGVGANTAAFSVADFVLVRPLPFHEPERLVRLWSSTPGYPQMELSPANYRDWKNAATSFDAIGAYTTTAYNLVTGHEPVRVQAANVAPDLLAALGVQPIVGRLFVASDTVAARSVLLSHELWTSSFGGDRAVVGRTIDLDGVPHAIIGVMPRFCE